METFLLIWAWFSSIVLGILLARKKGTDGVEGFFYGLLFGPLGVIAIGLAPTTQERAEMEEWTAKQRVAAKAAYAVYTDAEVAAAEEALARAKAKAKTGAP